MKKNIISILKLIFGMEFGFKNLQFHAICNQAFLSKDGTSSQRKVWISYEKLRQQLGHFFTQTKTHGERRKSLGRRNLA